MEGQRPILADLICLRSILQPRSAAQVRKAISSHRADPFWCTCKHFELAVGHVQTGTAAQMRWQTMTRRMSSRRATTTDSAARRRRCPIRAASAPPLSPSARRACVALPTPCWLHLSTRQLFLHTSTDCNCSRCQRRVPAVSVHPVFGVSFPSATFRVQNVADAPCTLDSQPLICRPARQAAHVHGLFCLQPAKRKAKSGGKAGEVKTKDISTFFQSAATHGARCLLCMAVALRVHVLHCS